jgi:hypothetical protein
MYVIYLGCATFWFSLKKKHTLPSV